MHHQQILSADAATLVRRAIRLLKAHGWTRGVWEDETGRLSTDGALRKAAFGAVKNAAPADDPRYWTYAEAFTALQSHIRQAQPNPHLGVDIWNDDHCRDQEHAIRTLQALIALRTDHAPLIEAMAA